MFKGGIEIRKLTTADRDLLPAGVKLLNETQGIGLFADDYLSSRVADSNAYVLGAFDQDCLIGLAVTQVIQDLTFHLPGSVVGQWSWAHVGPSVPQNGLRMRSAPG